MSTLPLASVVTSSCSPTNESGPTTTATTSTTTTDHQSRPEWNKRLQELQAFKTRFGHPNVPPTWSEQEGLSEWVYKQRTADTHERLSDGQKKELEHLGAFVFKTKDQRWHTMLHRLYQFWKLTGTFQVPNRQSTEMNKLNTWVAEQRRFHRTDRMRSDRKSSLEAIGFVFYNPKRKSTTATTATTTATLWNGSDNAQSLPLQQQQQCSIKREDNGTVVSSPDVKRIKTAIAPVSVVSMVEEIPSALEKKKPSPTDPPRRSIVPSPPLEGSAEPMTRPNPPSVATSTTTLTTSCDPSHQESTVLPLTTTSTTTSIMAATAVSQSKGIIATEDAEEDEEQHDSINLRLKNHEGHEGESNESEEEEETELSTSLSPSAPPELEQAPDEEEQQQSQEQDEQLEQQQQQQQQQQQNPQGDEEYIQVTPNLCAALLFSFHAQNSHFNIHPDDEPCYSYLQAIQSGQMVPDDAARLALLLKGFVFDPEITRDLFENGMQQFLAHQINSKSPPQPPPPSPPMSPAEMPLWLRLWESCVRQDCLPISKTKKSYLTAVGFDWGRAKVKVEE